MQISALPALVCLSLCPASIAMGWGKPFVPATSSSAGPINAGVPQDSELHSSLPSHILDGLSPNLL